MAHMRRKQKYIAYIDHDYFAQVCAQCEAHTPEKQNEIRLRIYDVITEFLKNDRDDIVLLLDKYKTDTGQLIRSVDFIPFNSLGQVHKSKRRIFKK